MEPLILAYCTPDSVRPGDTVRFMVSCEGATRFRADIVRLGCCATGPQGPGFREVLVETEVNGDYPARRQTIAIGSYARVPGPNPANRLASFSLLAYIWPTLPQRGPQAVLGTWSEVRRSGYGLHIDEQGALALRIGDGSIVRTLTSGEPLAARRWYLVAGTFDAATGNAMIFQEPVADRVFPPARTAVASFACDVIPGAGAPGVLIAAWHAGEGRCGAEIGAHFDGKIERPRLCDRALEREALIDVASRDVPPDLRPAVVGAWDFSRDISNERITDLSDNALHGETVNLPARAVTGVEWSGETHDWRLRPDHYGAIHFHSDDLYDADWEADFVLRIPPSLASGIYAARLRSGSAECHVPFYIRPRAGRASVKVVFLVSNATYMAYANIRIRITSPSSDALTGRLTVVDPIDLAMLAHPELGVSTYDAHADGSSVCYSSRLRPIVNHRPKESDLPLAYNTLASDLLVIDWLDHIGMGYDVVTDEDLHHEGLASLAGYRVVVTGPHPEYHSEAMLDALDGFVRAGGRLMYLGGNGFYWRVAFRADKPGVIELRRAQMNVARWNPGPGQYLHSFTGEHGGLWRDLGRAPQMLCGVGFVAQGFDVGAPYRRTAASYNPRAAFIFDGVEEDGIGDFGLMPGGVAGIELDRFDRRRGSPEHALVVASSGGHSNVYEPFDEMLPGGIDPLTGGDAIRADMVYFETPGGGAVFSVGSIAFAYGLSHNHYANNVARIAANVMTRFVDPRPLPDG